MVGSPTSYASLVEQEYYPADVVHAAVPGALVEYDLADLAASLEQPPLQIPATERGFQQLVELIRPIE